MAAKEKAKPAKKSKGIWQRYEKKGDSLVRKNKNCPKCGDGYALAAHNNRAFCGSCGYTEFGKK